MVAGAAALGLVLRLAAFLLLDRRAAPRRGFGGPDDRPVHARGGFVGEGDLGVDEPGRSEPVEVLGPGQGTGDATDVGAALGPVGRGEVVLSQVRSRFQGTPRLNTPGVVTTMYGLPVWTVDTVAARITPTATTCPSTSPCGSVA